MFTFDVRRGDEVVIDVDVEIEFAVTSWGAPATPPSYASGGDPPEPPEIEIVNAWDQDHGGSCLAGLLSVHLEQAQIEILENIDEYADFGPDYD